MARKVLETIPTYDVWANGELTHTGVSLDDAAAAIAVDASECEWALGCNGRCDVAEAIVVRHGATKPEPLEEPDTRANSVVRSKYKEAYRQRGNARGCGDWVHDELAKRTLTPDRKLIVDAFEAICAANGVDTSKYNRTSNGWQGRLRMSGSISLRSKAAKQGYFLDADGTEIRRAEPMLEAAE